jgi:flagellar biosynthesis protein FlhF
MEQTVRAHGYEAALAAVRRDLGPEAIILGTREIAGTREVEIRARVGGEPSAQDVGLIERRLVRAGVPTTAAETLTRAIVKANGAVPPSLRAARDALTRVLEREMIFAGPIGRAPRVIAVVGPTGVGKTTTIAKLAANASLVDGRNVGLVCLDQYRIGGAEQLRKYAELIGIPMELADDAPGMDRALRRLAACDLVLVDTAGRSPRDTTALQRLGQMLRGAREAIEVHLAFGAQVQDRELAAMLDVHVAALQPHRLLATKLDEALHHGSLVAAQVHAGIPYGYFTTGQRVPEDLEVASARRVAGLLCGEEVSE